MPHCFYFGVIYKDKAVHCNFLYLHKFRIQLEIGKTDFIAVLKVYTADFNWLCSVTTAQQIYILLQRSQWNTHHRIPLFVHWGKHLCAKDRKTSAFNNP